MDEKLEDLKTQAEIAHTMMRNHKVKIDEAQQILNDLEEEQKIIDNSFEGCLHRYYSEKLQVKAGDIIKCGDEEFEFVRFGYFGDTPIVHYKLKSGKWSRKEQTLHLYSWKTKSLMTLGNLVL